MADQDKQTDAQRRISEDQRYRYIGFEVYPGKPKDLFKSEAEKEQLVDAVVKRRTRGEILRDQCTLLIERVSGTERLFLAAASIVVLLSLFLPWYSVYSERMIESTVATAPAEPVAVAPTDTLGMAGSPADTLPAGQAAGTDTVAAPVEQPIRREEIVTGAQTRTKVERDYTTLSGLGSLIAVGSVGGALFSGGPILMLSAVLMLALTLLAVALPIFMLVTLFKTKNIDDQFALKLKKLLRLNWLPVVLFVLVLLLSFFGADYGSGVVGSYTSIGEAYGPGVFLGSLSYGILVALGASIIMAAKGIEI